MGEPAVDGLHLPGPGEKVETIRAHNSLEPGHRPSRNRIRLSGLAEGKSNMARIGTRAEVWFSNVIASFARYVAERTLSESVPMLMRQDAVMDSFNYAKENMKGAYSFLDRV